MDIGFVINPIAGMGGTVGLKGTDGEILEEARRRGAKPISIDIATKAMSKLVGFKNIKILTCKGDMGETSLKALGLRFEIIYFPSEKTTALDTKNACKEFMKKKVEMILFCGGDGTAVDVFDAVKNDVPILGIPSGVKMFSSVFAINPNTVGYIVSGFLEKRIELRKVEIMDIDEKKYREGILEAKLVGYALCPYEETYVQSAKYFHPYDDETSKKEIAMHLKEEILKNKDTLFIFGPGSTTETVLREIGLEKSLLGVDAILNNMLIGFDLAERDILELLKKYNNAKIVLSPIGGQGFILGRGNKQLSKEVIKKVGIDNIIIIATPSKLANTTTLLVDTGDEELDNELRGYRRILAGYRYYIVRKIS